MLAVPGLLQNRSTYPSFTTHGSPGGEFHRGPWLTGEEDEAQEFQTLPRVTQLRGLLHLPPRLWSPSPQSSHGQGSLKKASGALHLGL